MRTLDSEPLLNELYAVRSLSFALKGGSIMREAEPRLREAEPNLSR